jgi:hypothetical protein
MVESSSGAATAMIEAVRQELNHFQGQQRDPAVLLRCTAIDIYLATALQGRDEPRLRKTLASTVEKLAEAVRNAKFGSPVANEVESASRVISVMSVMIQTLDPGSPTPLGA